MTEPPTITISKEDYIISRLASALNVKAKLSTEKFKKSIVENEDSL